MRDHWAMSCPSWCEVTVPHDLHEAGFGPWVVIQGEGDDPSVLFPLDEIGVKDLAHVLAELTRLISHFDV